MSTPFSKFFEILNGTPFPSCQVPFSENFKFFPKLLLPLIKLPGRGAVWNIGSEQTRETGAGGSGAAAGQERRQTVAMKRKRSGLDGWRPIGARNGDKIDDPFGR